MRVAASVVNARREELAEKIASEGYLHLEELCRKMGVSVATARRDLAHLHSKGRIARIRGGALHRHRVQGDASRVAPERPEAKVHAVDEATATVFQSQAARNLMDSICECGRRAWMRRLVDGATGSISARLGDQVLCSPAGVSPGAIRPEMICMVDLEGKHAASHRHWRRSVELNVDLAIYKAVTQAAAVIHAHPPHATAFAISGIEPPRNVLAEFEVFTGTPGFADYRTPGSEELSGIVGQLAPHHASILLKSHGVICWGTSVEDALMRMEMTEAYCQTASIASRLPGHLTHLPSGEIEKLTTVRRGLGLPAG